MAKHYAIADIHGMYDIYTQVCDMLESDDVVYFLGDAGDRGYDCFRCVKEIYENPQWIYIKGNHEDLMIKGLREQMYHGLKGTEDFQLWHYNGGGATFYDWVDDGEDWTWVERLDSLPVLLEYTNPKGITFHMSHAGYTCGHKDEMWDDELVWSRSHFADSWDEEFYPNDICIHGHTPIEYLVRKLNWLEKGTKSYYVGQPEARSYCNGHKICIDNGVFYTKSTVLYDLDEMVAIPLYSNSDFEW